MFVENFFFLFGDTLTTNNILSHNLSDIFDCQIVQSYARLLNILTNRTTALGMYSVLITKDLVD